MKSYLIKIPKQWIKQLLPLCLLFLISFYLLPKKAVSAEEGFLVGLSTSLLIFSGAEIRNDTERTIIDGNSIGRRVDIPNTASEAAIDAGAGLKLGYTFPEWRIYLSYYIFEFDDKEFNSSARSNFTLIIADWLPEQGFFLGGGIGTGSIENFDLNEATAGTGNSSENDTNENATRSGNALLFNGGYNLELNENIALGFGILFTSFDINKSSQRVSCGSDQCNDEVTTSLQLTSLYSDLFFSF